MVFEIPQKVEIIINILEKAGYEAYAVGGCVRDALLGRTPNDWDITTSAKPEQVKALFHRTCLLYTSTEYNILEYNNQFEKKDVIESLFTIVN